MNKKSALKAFVKVELYVTHEIEKYNVILDRRGHFYRLPFVSTNGRQYKTIILKPFLHDGYQCIRVNTKIVSVKKAMANAKPVNYRKWVEIALDRLPDELKHLNVIKSDYTYPVQVKD